MAYNFSRRDFMKCAGVTVLAVAAGGLLTGCGGAGVDDGSYLPAKKDTNITADNANGKVVTQVVGWQDGWTPSSASILGDLEKLASQITGGNASVTWMSVIFKVTNNTDQPIQLGNTAENALSSVILALTTGHYEKLDQLGRQNFDITTDKGAVHHADIGYQMGNDGLPNAYGNTLEKGATGFIKMYCIVPSKWSKMYLTYKPDYAANKSVKFVLTTSDKIAK